MKKINLEKLKEIGEKATEGPWVVNVSGAYERIGSVSNDKWLCMSCFDSGPLSDLDHLKVFNIQNLNQIANNKFIVEARNNWEAMIEALEEAKEAMLILSGVTCDSGAKICVTFDMDNGVTKIIDPMHWLERFEAE